MMSNATTISSEPSSLSTAAARTLASTTKTAPQAQASSPRYLISILPWLAVDAGTYRLTRTTRRALARDGSDQPAVVTSAGHAGETVLPGMYVDYELPAREFTMSVAQTVLKIHTRVDELYNRPMNQFEQQLRLTTEALRERQEHELLNNQDFGLLRNAAPRHTIKTRSGPPTPADLDSLLAKQTRPRYLLAHPRAIAAFARQCNREGITAPSLHFDGQPVLSWRGVPMLPCDKVPISPQRTTTILVLRPGEDRQGVVGLCPAHLADQDEPGVSVEKLGTDTRGVTSHLVSIYYSVTMLVPNCVCALTDVELD